MRFNATTDMTSMIGNVALMGVLAGVLGMNPIVANALVVGVMTFANFAVADRWAFRTVAAWNRYVAETEARLDGSRAAAMRAGETIVTSGDSIDVPSGIRAETIRCASPSASSATPSSP